MAQSGSALAWGARGPEFKSRRSDQSNHQVTSDADPAISARGTTRGTSSTFLTAFIPPSTRRRWDLAAVEQVCERLAALEVENEELRRELADADASAEFWHQNAMELAGDHVGITVEGRLVRVEP